MGKETLSLIPKSEKYIQYILKLILKLPRTEKFSIGNEYKRSLYIMLENIMYLNKSIKINSKYFEKSKYEDRKIGLQEKDEKRKYIIEEVLENVKILNKIDCMLNTQRIYLRIMYKNKWIDEHKFNVAMEQIYEIGKIIGGLIKYYAKNN